MRKPPRVKQVLKNGVALGSRMYESKGGGYSITKAQARQVFVGSVTHIVSKCISCDNPHIHEYDVSRRGKSVRIGCIRFSATDRATVLKWIGRK
jgi:hypothetical protein